MPAQQRRIEFRIGVNLGDVIVEGDDIYGDGVNVAVRLESIASPGGITISRSVRDHVGNRLDLDFEDMGEQTTEEYREGRCGFTRVVSGQDCRESRRNPDRPWNAHPSPCCPLPT